MGAHNDQIPNHDPRHAKPAIDGQAHHAGHHHNTTEQTSEENNPAVARIRKKHRRKNRKLKRGKGKKHRLIFWIQMLLLTFLVLSIGLTIRAMELISMKNTGTSWVQELEQGHYDLAVDKFSVLASNAVGSVFDSDMSTKALMKDFNAALPHLKKAGYTLTELEVELGIPPKLIPHFYHNPDVKLNMNQSLDLLKGNSIGTALMLALSKAGDLQKELSVSGMQFSHIEVELGPIPSLKLQYKNNLAIEDYIHKEAEH